MGAPVETEPDTEMLRSDPARNSAGNNTDQFEVVMVAARYAQEFLSASR
ncbi:hypothetical protein [Amycolatopsis cihanbeyliensis]|nr:hypothetical protein [Amycolatopsis cihanbeyliensis]